jgi:magnesium transporter
MSSTLADSTVDELLQARDWPALGGHLAVYPPAYIANVLADLADRDRLALFRALPRAEAYRSFPYLPRFQRQVLLRDLDAEETSGLMAALPPDVRTRVLGNLPAAATDRLLGTLGAEDVALARRLLAYPRDSVGRLMTPEVCAVRPESTIGEALDHIRRVGHDAETLDMIYVVDERGVLLDDLRLRLFVLADPAAPVSSIMDHRFVALRATDDRREAVRLMNEHQRVALPVLETDGTLVGIVTVDDMLQVAERDATAEIQRLGGSEALEAPYMTIDLRRMIRKRAGWLSALFLGEMLTATAMGYFEDEIARAVVLALFVPLIISSGGNSGSQATSLVIRAMALGEVRLRDWARVLLREAPTGIILGAILGVIGLVRILAWQFAGFSDYGEFYFRVALTVFLSLIGVVLFGSLAGSLLPFVLRRLGFDPASASAPFVATLVDVSGLIIYFTVASLVLRGTVL